MHTPLVSFIVPCFKLAHFLEECVRSILQQSFQDFEILIMDDCSPDNTGDVARSIKDPRVRYIRNEPNLGHLRNYNKGIELSRGRFVWLISADDRIRSSHALKRYVDLMSANPRVGYVFSSGFGLVDGKETGVLKDYAYGPEDILFDGRDFISTALRQSKGLLSPSVMVRRDCYDKISMFPLDLPHQGDLYLWFVWALEHDVAYIAEPLVSYRLHPNSMMQDFKRRIPKTVFYDEVNVLWRVRTKAITKGYEPLVSQLEFGVAGKYAGAVARTTYGEANVDWSMTTEECLAELHSNVATPAEFQRIGAKFWERLADYHEQRLAFRQARECYVRSLRNNWFVARVWTKFLLATLGPAGRSVRDAIRQRKLRRNASATAHQGVEFSTSTEDSVAQRSMPESMVGEKSRN